MTGSEKRIWVVVSVVVALVCVVAAFGTGTGDGGTTDDDVFLGEVDLAERAEIWRNQYRRMTPGGEPLVQDVGAWPAAWEEFGRAWDAAPARRDLATWLVPFSAERTGNATVLRDANGTVLWSGTTDFAKDESANVTLAGALVNEADWALWEAARGEIERRLGSLREPKMPMRGGLNGPCTTGMHFVSASADFTNTPPSFIVGLVWTNNGTVDVFAYGPLHTSDTHVVTYTNDENEVITWTNTMWHCTEPTLTGRYDNLWELAGTLSVSNTGTNVFIDTNFPPERAKVRYYAAFETGDADNDGLNDAFETAILGTSTNSTDSDNDGIGDWDEYHVHRTDPSASDSDHDGIDDPTEIQNQTNPNKWDTDGDGGGDAVDASPCVSNLWWIVSKTTNEWTGYGHVFVGDEPSWPTEPVWTNQLIVQGNRPYSNAIPGRVTLWGLVDDAIMVDSNKVAWEKGAKVFSNLDVTASITNIASDSFRIDLFDWPDLPDGGPNEVRLGREDFPFRAVWEWWVPIEMRMEPIMGGTLLPLDNPCGVASNGTAWFHVDVVPDGVVPATNVAWASLNQNVEFVATNRGYRVQVRGAEEGEDELQVSIEGAQGNFGIPPFHVKVLPLTVVTAKVGIVTTATTDWSVQTQRVATLVANANAVLAQAGLAIEIDGIPVAIPDLPGGGYYELDEEGTAVLDLFQMLSGTGIIKLYFVGNILESTGYDPAAFDSDQGMALSVTASGVTLAHEICHRCGLEDIYAVHPFAPSWVVEGEISEERLPSDWGCYRLGGEAPILQTNLISRLLMYCFNEPDATDIPSDEVYGLWHIGDILEGDWDEGLAPVGLGDMNDVPCHE